MTNAASVLNLQETITPDSLARYISSQYDDWKNQRQTWISQQEELQRYLFAIDTSTTANAAIGWKNSTTLPKLTQIRDNLHANYMAALFPNENWLKWEAFSKEEASKKRKNAIMAYMRTKLVDSGFRQTISQLLYDYIDYGNAFCDVIFVNETKRDPETKEIIPGYVGPRLRRISPYDIVFNPAAIDFASSPKITRTLVSFGELERMIEESPEDKTWVREALAQSSNVRKGAGQYSSEDFSKAFAYSMDGFGDLKSYFASGYVEVLEFEGDAYDTNTNKLYKDYIITVIDRTKVVRMQQHPVWIRKMHKFHVGWRTRPDNIYAMGPLHNLVGMQYRVDHLENLKADVFDLIAFPPLLIVGEVEEFEWKPMEQIIAHEAADVRMLSPNPAALSANLEIGSLQSQMEQFAGAPKEAMGIRTPGEKTAFEVSQLMTSAGRIFQEKVEQFELMVEEAVNAMLETGRRNLDSTEIARIQDNEFGITQFIEVTKDDISGYGKLRPMGARHYNTQSQLIQTLLGLVSSPLGQMVAPHINTKKLSGFIEDVLGLERFDLMTPNAALYEQAERQKLGQVLNRDIQLREFMQDTVEQIAEDVATSDAASAMVNEQIAQQQSEQMAAAQNAPVQQNEVPASLPTEMISGEEEVNTEDMDIE